MKRTAFLGFLASLLLGTTASATAAPEIGQPAPAFRLPSESGKEVSLSDFKGKIVVLEWTNEGCPFVKMHYESGNMQGLQERYAAKGVVWLSVVSSALGKQGHFEDAEAATEWKRSVSGKQAAILLDPEGAVGRAYGAKTTPHMFVVGKDGTLLYDGAIDDKPGTSARGRKNVKNWVKKALDEALKGAKVTVPLTRPYGCSVKYKD